MLPGRGRCGGNGCRNTDGKAAAQAMPRIDVIPVFLIIFSLS